MRFFSESLSTSNGMTGIRYRMNTGGRARLRRACLRLGAVFGVVLALLCGVSSAGEQVVYRFERLWPTLQQPWYFGGCSDMAQGSDELLYIADAVKACVHVVDTGGHYVTTIGGTDQFAWPDGVALDSEGNVYVADSSTNSATRINSRGELTPFAGAFDVPKAIAVDNTDRVFVGDANGIHIFDTDGELITQWPGIVTYDIEFDSEDNVYVFHYNPAKVQKFSADGELLLEWGHEGPFIERLIGPICMAFDGSDRLYVADLAMSRIVVYSTSGAWLDTWDHPGDRADRFKRTDSVAIDDNGYVYVADGSGIWKLTADCEFISRWSSGGAEPGRFDFPSDVAVDSTNAVYVADRANHRIQKFSAEGQFVWERGGRGAGGGLFELPVSIDIGIGDAVYVGDYGNSLVQMFSSSGDFLDQWGAPGTGQGQFEGLTDIAIDSAGSVLVLENGDEHARVQKFGPDGTYVTEWGSYGTGDGQFNIPISIAVGPDDTLYVSDFENARVQTFTNDGDYVSQWQYDFKPTAITVSHDNEVFVVDLKDQTRSRVLQFTTDGQFVGEVLPQGTDPGQVYGPGGLAATGDGFLYVADTRNNRIQKFHRVVLTENSKAIIGAGGGPFPGDN